MRHTLVIKVAFLAAMLSVIAALAGAILWGDSIVWGA